MLLGRLQRRSLYGVSLLHLERPHGLSLFHGFLGLSRPRRAPVELAFTVVRHAVPFIASVVIIAPVTIIAVAIVGVATLSQGAPAFTVPSGDVFLRSGLAAERCELRWGVVGVTPTAPRNFASI